MSTIRNNHTCLLSQEIDKYLIKLGMDINQVRVQRRIQQVYAMWEDIIDPAIVKHTNAVFLKKTEQGKILTVYVDGSLYAAELRARQELIKIQFFCRYKEEISEFKVFISRGRYKTIYPFNKKEDKSSSSYVTPKDLSEKQKEMLIQALDKVQDKKFKESLMKAAITDIKWKNGLNIKNNEKDVD